MFTRSLVHQPRSPRFITGLALALMLLIGCSTQPTLPGTQIIAMATEVSATSAIIWARTPSAGSVQITLIRGQEHEVASKRISPSASDDFTLAHEFKQLDPDTSYRYTIEQAGSAAEGTRNLAVGSFRTAPAAEQTRPVSIAFTGDFAGQNVCRDAQEGFVLVPAIVEEQADLFIGLGDMIYADGVCEAIGKFGNAQVPGDFGPSTTLEDFHAHWRYAREDPAMGDLLLSTPYAGVWDDHEVVNDFGPLSDTRSDPPYQADQALMPIGLRAFLDYNPMSASLHASQKESTGEAVRSPDGEDSANRLYRVSRWGQHLELYYLDTRQHRDDNKRQDDQAMPKTLLGQAQLDWLLSGVKNSDATWKVIVSSVPLSIPTGWPITGGRDGWADFAANSASSMTPNPSSSKELATEQSTGFERELLTILRTLREAQANVLFISTDVHFAEVFRYTPFVDQPDFKIHEMVVGPGSAGLYPSRDFDSTLNPEPLFFYGPKSAETVTTWEAARQWFNYGLFSVSATGELTMTIKQLDGAELFQQSLSPMK